MKSLLWMQWRENRIYLAIFVAWMILAACYCIGYEVGYQFRAAVGSFSGLALFYTMCAAIFLAMRTAQGEETEGTIAFSASLPVSMQRIAAMRISAAAATLAIPILLAAVVLSLALVSGLIEQATPRTASYLERLPERQTASLLTSLEQLWSVAIIAALGGIELMLMISLFGCWLRSQAQVGFLGAVMAMGSILAGGRFWLGEREPDAQLYYGAVFPQSLVVQWGYGAEVGGYTDHELAPYRWAALALATPVLLSLGYLFTSQYGKLRKPATTGTARQGRWIFPALWSYIPIRFPSRLLALTWLELRQSLPLVLYGLLFVFLITVAAVMMEPARTYSAGELLRSELPHMIAFVGMLWAVVVGSGLFAADLGEELGAFWRSRPISPSTWFWCKFFVGLVVVLSVLDGFTVLVTWNAPRNLPTEGMSWAYVLCFPLLHAWMYALAVLGTCWLRKPAIGGFLAILSKAVLTLVITAFPATNWLEPIHVYNSLLFAEREGHAEFLQHNYPLVYGTLAVSILLIALLSSRLAQPLRPENRWLAAASS